MTETPQLTKIQIYCSALYATMDAEAVTVTLSDGTEVKVWKGLITATAASVGAGEGVYSRVVDRLTAIGCIDVLDKGRRNHPSTVALHFPPTPEVWAQRISPKDLTSRPSPATMQAELNSLKSELGGVNLKLILKNFEDRLTKIELRLAKLDE